MTMKLWIINALVHEQLKHKSVWVVYEDGSSVEEYVSPTNFARHYHPHEDAELQKLIGSLGMKHSAIYQIIDTMQQISRRTNFNWFNVRDLNELHVGKQKSLHKEVMKFVFEHSTMDIGWYGYNGKILDVQNEFLSFKGGSEQHADHFDNVHQAEEGEWPQRAEYVIFEEALEAPQTRSRNTHFVSACVSM